MAFHSTVEWTVFPGGAPRPALHCAACGLRRAFAFGGKARLNANGKRLDAWLIYRCTSCGGTWNRPVFSRRRTSEIAPGLLDALQQNAPVPLLAIARDRATLTPFTRQMEEDGVDLIRRRFLGEVAAARPGLTLRLIPTHPPGPRIDRILAGGLGMARQRLIALGTAGRVEVVTGGPEVLRRPLRGVAEIRFDLGEEADAERIVARARDG